MKTEKIDLNHLQSAANLLLNGEIVAFPTETVYGLGASIFLEKAVQKIFEAKGRPSDNPLIAHISDLSSIEQIAKNVPPIFYQLAESFFPGPLTLVVPKSDRVPSLVSAGLDTVAIRMPAHEIAQELIRLVGSPLVAPSANLSGKPSSTQVSHVLDDFEGKIAGVVLGGPCEIGIESTVVSLLHGKVEILRPGAISQEEIEECLKQKISFFKKEKHIGPLPSPGMKYRHYAPDATVHLCSSLQEALNLHEKSASKGMILANHPGYQSLEPSSFYAKLRQADLEKYEEIFLVCDERVLQNKGLMNRIEKSALKTPISDS